MLDYLLHYGSENVISYCEDNLYEIKTLREFQYVDEYSVDHGANVRHKASEITNLLLDRARLKREYEAARRNREHWAAFRLKYEMDRAEKETRELHAKAARRFYRGTSGKPLLGRMHGADDGV